MYLFLLGWYYSSPRFVLQGFVCPRGGCSLEGDRTNPKTQAHPKMWQVERSKNAGPRKSLLVFVVPKRRKWPILDPKSERFPCENANLPHCTYFTHIHPPPGSSLPGAGGGVQKGGGHIKFLPRGASNIHPHPRQKNALWAENGVGGGGACTIFPWKEAAISIGMRLFSLTVEVFLLTVCPFYLW